VIRLLALFLFCTTFLFAQKVIYLKYEQTPQRVIKGEIFPVTFKTLSTVQEFKDINYTFLNHPGVEILDESAQREQKGKYFYDTFHFVCNSVDAKLPDVEAFLVTKEDNISTENNLSVSESNITEEDNVSVDESSITDINISNKMYEPTKILGDTLNVIALNPRKDFSNIIADDFEIQEYKTTNFDNKHNIVVFVATAQNANLSALHFQNVYKQGIESQPDGYENPKIIYFIVIDKRVENFTFSYFSLKKNRFENLNIPIVVDDDSVTTQSDLKPTDQSHNTIKMYIAIGIAFVGFILVLIRKRYIYLLFIFLPLGYVAYLAIPQEKICIKQGASIYLLPVRNSTTFEVTTSRLYLPKEGSVEKFVKVKLPNDKIGWIKNEDVCTY